MAANGGGKRRIRVTHRPSGTELVDGPLGWGVTPFEGNLYVRRRYLKTNGFKPNFVPGLCIYKFLYVWMDLHLEDGSKVGFLGWFYFLANPIFPFIWWRVGIPRHHPELEVEEYESA